GQPAPQPQPAGPTPEQTAINADLHWLIHQGHVIEFANGVLETAKKPVPKPPKPPKPAEKQGEAAPQPEPAATGEIVDGAGVTGVEEVPQQPPAETPEVVPSETPKRQGATPAQEPQPLDSVPASQAAPREASPAAEKPLDS